MELLELIGGVVVGVLLIGLLVAALVSIFD
jgi:hypothetical protein